MTLDIYRGAWREVPAGTDEAPRQFTDRMADLHDDELLAFWDRMAAARDDTPLGFLQPLYRDFFRGRRVLDVGSGLGYDGLRFAAAGASWVFADIVPTNLAVIRRVAALKGLQERVQFHLIPDDLAFDTVPTVDAVIAIGSVHHVPFEIARRECSNILSRLQPNGRWLELVYPRTRWEKEGRLSFERWGAMTDSPNTPWSEWYDLEKLQRRLAPSRFRALLDFDFQGTDFHWFDLERRG